MSAARADRHSSSPPAAPAGTCSRRKRSPSSWSGAAPRCASPPTGAPTRLAAQVPGVEIRQICAGRLGGGPFRSAYGVAAMAVGLVQARRLLRRLDPAAVVGFGGYPSVPTMLAATQLGFPTVIHEQNAVLGRANRLLARRVRRIATGFAETAGLRPADRARAVHTGNPVRPAIRAVARIAYRPPQPGSRSSC